MTILNTIYSASGPSIIQHSILPNPKKVNEGLTGTLYLSKSGYVYNGQSRSALWIKFLGLGVSLPFRILIGKVCNIFKRFANMPTNEKGAHDARHMLKLSSIAWKGVFGGNRSLKDRAVCYSMEELDYNSKDSLSELEKPRSQRILKGYYTARCMHPLFHQKQIQPKLVEQMEQLEKKFGFEVTYLPAGPRGVVVEIAC